MIEQFDKFVSGYDMNNIWIKRKFDHTKRVADLSYKIATELGLSENEINLAYTIGILHDISRFEQVKVYQTFMDSPTFNHGIEAAKLLFDKGLIKNFDVDSREYALIRLAIENHNRYQIEFAKEEREILHSKIIRDADKLDIFYLFTHETAPSPDEFKSSGISKNVATHISEGKLVDNRDVKTRLDYSLKTIGFAYDLYFKSSIEVYLTVYHADLVNSFEPYLNKKDFRLLKEYAEKMAEHLRSIL